MTLAGCFCRVVTKLARIARLRGKRPYYTRPTHQMSIMRFVAREGLPARLPLCYHPAASPRFTSPDSYPFPVSTRGNSFSVVHLSNTHATFVDRGRWFRIRPNPSIEDRGLRPNPTLDLGPWTLDFWLSSFPRPSSAAPGSRVRQSTAP